ncbi:MAG: 30S ribosomal protein S5 [Patescibacteria group bacterium]
MVQPRRSSSLRERGTREPEEFEQKLIEIKRVTRVQKGGKRMRFRALVAIGDRKGRVGYGLGKGADVSQAIAKATTAAKKRVITVPLVNETIPHAVRMRYKAAAIYVKPAPKGTGIIAGGAIRQVLMVSGIANAVAKMLGSENKVNNVKLTIKALQSLKSKPQR